MAGATSTGILHLPNQLYFCPLLISNTKAIKPAVTVGASQKWKIGPCPGPSPFSLSTPHVENRTLRQRRPAHRLDRLRVLISSPTVSTNPAQLAGRKNGRMSGKIGGNRRLRAQLFGQ